MSSNQEPLFLDSLLPYFRFRPRTINVYAAFERFRVDTSAWFWFREAVLSRVAASPDRTGKRDQRPRAPDCKFASLGEARSAPPIAIDTTIQNLKRRPGVSQGRPQCTTAYQHP